VSRFKPTNAFERFVLRLHRIGQLLIVLMGVAAIVAVILMFAIGASRA
jgi:hypothetical protein